jgi:hypothetical protein
MRSLLGFFVCAVLLVAMVPARSSAQTTLDCAGDSRPPSLAGALIAESPRNTLVFNHYVLAATRKGPHVLAVRDGGYFQVRFICTDPTKFNYTITANTDEQQKAAVQGVTGDHVETRDLSRSASVTMRHSRLFTRYRVEVSLRDELKSKTPSPSLTDTGGGAGRAGQKRGQQEGTYVLYSTYFDLWVDTLPEWTVDFSGGVAFTGLRGHEYFIKTDTKNTADANDDVKTVEEDTSARASFRPDIVALANVRHPRMKGLGVTFGVGLNNDADPRYFLGLSYLLGGKFIFNAGWAGGKVNELPVGQELHKAPINGDNTLTTPAGRFRNAFYVGLGFTFVNREDQFKGAFAATQHTSDEEQKPAAAAPSRDDYAGTYTSGADTVTIEPQGEKLMIKLTPQGAAEELKPDDDLHYHVGDDKTRVLTFKRDDANKIASVEYRAGNKTTTYKKKSGGQP